MTKVAVIETSGYWSGHRQFVVCYDENIEKLEDVLGKAGITYPNRKVVNTYYVSDMVISKNAKVKKLTF